MEYIYDVFKYISAILFKLRPTHRRIYNAIINWNNILNKLIGRQFHNNNADSILKISK